MPKGVHERRVSDDSTAVYIRYFLTSLKGKWIQSEQRPITTDSALVTGRHLRRADVEPLRRVR